MTARILTDMLAVSSQSSYVPLMCWTFIYPKLNVTTHNFVAVRYQPRPTMPRPHSHVTSWIFIKYVTFHEFFSDYPAIPAPFWVKTGTGSFQESKDSMSVRSVHKLHTRDSWWEPVVSPNNIEEKNMDRFWFWTNKGPKIRLRSTITTENEVNELEQTTKFRWFYCFQVSSRQ